MQRRPRIPAGAILHSFYDADEAACVVYCANVARGRASMCPYTRGGVWAKNLLQPSIPRLNRFIGDASRNQRGLAVLLACDEMYIQPGHA